MKKGRGTSEERKREDRREKRKIKKACQN